MPITFTEHDDHITADVTIARAHPATSKSRANSSTIRIFVPTEKVAPEFQGGDVRPYEDACRDFYRAQAEDIYAALRHALPGGTLDALLGVMALAQASLLRVERRAGYQMETCRNAALHAAGPGWEAGDPVTAGEVRGTLVECGTCRGSLVFDPDEEQSVQVTS